MCLPGVSLRGYQSEGVKWIEFLFRYKLSGCLCDDMGLGKTLQTLVAAARLVSEGERSVRGESVLIVVPGNLEYHWRDECRKFIKPSVLRPKVVLARDVRECQSMSAIVQRHSQSNVFVVSYRNLVRLGEVGAARFKLAIIDEGHLIKNPKSATTLAVKGLSSELKLCLTGTPIQNNVIELWSIFDFLLPSYLDSVQNFKKRYRELLNLSFLNLDFSKVALNDSQQQVLADLHKRVLPFILRRDKRGVLKDLPDKIIQDYPCRMSGIQLQLYRELEATSQHLEQSADDHS